MEQLQPIIVIVIGILLLGFVWKLIKGMIRLVITLLIIGAAIYFLLPMIQ